MKKAILILLLVPSIVFGQNLVMNPSFEDTVSCPSGQNQVHKAFGWSNFGLSPDYFNACHNDFGFPEFGFSVPSNWGGYQIAASGQAYSALGTYSPAWNNQREFIGGQLINPLIIGEKYFVSFKTSLSIADDIESYLATNNLGVDFSTIQYSETSSPSLTNSPKVFSNQIITDTLSWTTIFGSFVADSSYTNIILGNFFDDNNTDTINIKNSTTSFAYYFIDDVCVSTDSVYALNYTANISEIKNNMFNIFPNPIIEDFILIKSNFPNTIYDLKIFNIVGEEIFSEKNITDKEHKIVLDQKIKSNILYIMICHENQVYNYKFIKT